MNTTTTTTTTSDLRAEIANIKARLEAIHGPEDERERNELNSEMLRAQIEEPAEQFPRSWIRTVGKKVLALQNEALELKVRLEALEFELVRLEEDKDEEPFELVRLEEDKDEPIELDLDLPVEMNLERGVG